MPPASAVGIGLWLNPTNGHVMVEQGLGVGAAVLVWLVAVVLGLLTARLVMP